ncbi:hypothetical protein CI109_105036 [Kwoniella shandongensis]|uniref:Major facilitator superfamily (MFS) profile domain-containing protein n=1 Tax=Kwoniella shandongensis TaxID=1734106 RepID=A0A5M6C133_9TREE|nr:uncharacterized protein CI109_004365 [Kwoniella shandongensis]KAA5527305.1 hypothetical protein CI109_004365 [Kwoniella shandongensis]
MSTALEEGVHDSTKSNHDGIPDKNVDPQSGAVIEKKSRAERLFILRLDLILLIYICVSQVMKGLDQQNMSAAYVSGLKEDLGVKGNEYNYFTTYFNVGYCLFVIPSQITMTWMRPSLWLPFLEMCWGILTIGLYKVQSAKQIYAFRAFIGAFEASAYPGAITLLMSWYTPWELALRIAFYHSSQWVGSMLAGGLQAAIYNGLNGKNGIAGWRWMFIIDGIMTLVIAAMGVFLIPDFPSKPNPWSFWLKEKHITLAKERSLRFRRATNKRFTFDSVKRAVKQPPIYLFPTLYIIAQLSQQGYLYFNLWLKSLKHADGTPVWSVAQVNALPIGGYAIGIVCVWGWGYLSDLLRSRWIVIMAQVVLGLIPGIIMSIWDVPIGAKYFSYFLCFTFISTSPPLFAWLSDMTPHDAEQRAFIIGCCTAGWYAVNSWANVLIWPASKAPHYPHAWQVTIALWIVTACEVMLILYIDKRYMRPRNQKMAQLIYEETNQGQAALGIDIDNDNSRDDNDSEDGDRKPKNDEHIGSSGHGAKRITRRSKKAKVKFALTCFASLQAMLFQKAQVR